MYDAIAVPFGWLLGQFYNIFNNYFVAIAVFALLVKIALLPSAISQQKSSARQARLQSKVRRIQERYKGDKDAQRKIQEEQQALYQREGFNPMSGGCLPLVIQFPIIIGLYGAVYKPLTYCLRIPENFLSVLDTLVKDVEKYTQRSSEIFVMNNIDSIWQKALTEGVPETILKQIKNFDAEQFHILGHSLSQNPGFKMNLLILIPILSCVTSLATSLISFFRSKKNNPGAANNATMGCMTFGMPLFSLYFVTMFPAAIGIYWIINNVYSFIQTLIVGKIYSPENVIARTMVEETIQRRSKEINTKMVLEKKNY